MRWFTFGSIFLFVPPLQAQQVGTGSIDVLVRQSVAAANVQYGVLLQSCNLSVQTQMIGLAKADQYAAMGVSLDAAGQARMAVLTAQLTQLAGKMAGDNKKASDMLALAGSWVATAGQCYVLGQFGPAYFLCNQLNMCLFPAIQTQAGLLLANTQAMTSIVNEMGSLVGVTPGS